MTLRKNLLICSILLVCFRLGVGQNKPQAVLADEFGVLQQEDIAARLDSFLFGLKPDKTGYIVIHPGTTSAANKYRAERAFEGFVRTYASTNKFDKNRFTIVQSSVEDEKKYQFWVIPSGTDLPFDIKEWWAKPKLDLSKPFIFGNSSEIEIFTSFAPEFYAEHIKNNENLYGHIVLFYSSRSANRETSDKWIKILTEEYGVPRDRLKVFYAKPGISSVNSRKYDPVYEEFWLVPKKKK